MKSETLYKQLILDNYKKPKNQGTLPFYTHSSKESNASCGDHVSVTLQIEDGVIEDVKFQSDGCAISIAAASLLSQEIKGKRVADLGDLKAVSLNLINMKESSGREKCGTIAALAVQKAIDGRRF